MTKQYHTYAVCLLLCLSSLTANAQNTNIGSSAIPVSVTKDENNKPDSCKSYWQGWYYCAELGMHFSSFKDVDWHALNLQTRYGNINNSVAFWGQTGFLVSPWGIQYTRVFKKRFFWRVKSVWTFFYPDVRWQKGNVSPITLSSIPLIGQYLSLGHGSGWLSMAIPPVVYFDLGYVTSNNIALALGSVYLWGISPSITIPLSEHLFWENRFVFFLDKFFKKGWFGFHNCFFTIGVGYKFR